jgi:hypothetical protein
MHACTCINKNVQDEKAAMEMTQKFYPPNDDDTRHIAKQWMYVDQLIIDNFNGARLDQSLSDLDLIQRIIDYKIISPKQTWELQSLGIALGRVLAKNVPGLDWWIIDDEYGRDPTIRYKETSLCFNVLTMISKHVEDGEMVEIHNMYNSLLARLDELKDDVE